MSKFNIFLMASFSFCDFSDKIILQQKLSELQSLVVSFSDLDSNVFLCFLSIENGER